jgi:hypothetical protein
VRHAGNQGRVKISCWKNWGFRLSIPSVEYRELAAERGDVEIFPDGNGRFPDSRKKKAAYKSKWRRVGSG